VVVRKPNTGPSTGMCGGDCESHVIGFRRISPYHVVLALTSGHVTAFWGRPLTVTVAGCRRGNLLDGRLVITTIQWIFCGFRRFLIVHWWLLSSRFIYDNKVCTIIVKVILLLLVYVPKTNGVNREKVLCPYPDINVLKLNINNLGV